MLNFLISTGKNKNATDFFATGKWESSLAFVAIKKKPEVRGLLFVRPIPLRLLLL